MSPRTRASHNAAVDRADARHSAARDAYAAARDVRPEGAAAREDLRGAMDAAVRSLLRAVSAAERVSGFVRSPAELASRRHAVAAGAADRAWEAWRDALYAPESSSDLAAARAHMYARQAAEDRAARALARARAAEASA